VQGVFYRATCVELARELRLAGWVRNTTEGGVEAAFEGPREAVERMVAWCREGPPSAHVASIEVVDESVTGEEGFRVRRG
jgi:acylphosphatase